MTVKEIVKEYLEENGYDGLVKTEFYDFKIVKGKSKK